MANIVSMKQLLEAGVHFGHPTRTSDEKMEPENEEVHLHRKKRHLYR